ncbi:unnamed protein product [Pipistrellus nathusii]|uniref:Uncharacterized protein n=1 Tax=Pipistrellus nathusii TaxID=59473 RepID=A0ABN9ZG85_PIPNA
MSLLSAQALSIVSSLQEIKMDKLRGRVRAGSRFSRDSYIPAARLADGRPGPIMGARVLGAATPLSDKAPQTPRTAECLLPLWPSPSFISRVGEGRQEKERGGLRAQSGHEALSASQCPAALSGFPLPLLCSAQRGAGPL